MDNGTILLLVLAAIILPICGLIIGMIVVIGALVRRNANQAGELKTRWAAIAQSHGLTFNAGTALQDPSLTGTIDSQGTWACTGRRACGWMRSMCNSARGSSVMVRAS